MSLCITPRSKLRGSISGVESPGHRQRNRLQCFETQRDRRSKIVSKQAVVISCAEVRDRVDHRGGDADSNAKGAPFAGGTWWNCGAELSSDWLPKMSRSCMYPQTTCCMMISKECTNSIQYPCSQLMHDGLIPAEQEQGRQEGTIRRYFENRGVYYQIIFCRQMIS